MRYTEKYSVPSIDLKYNSMKKIGMIFISQILVLSSYAQDDQMAYFTYYVNNSIQVEAELPESIDEALIAFDPTLKIAASQADYEETLMEYLSDHLILENEDGDTLAISSMKIIDEDSSHEDNLLLLTYEGDDLATVTNTILFDANEEQINYNTVIHSAGQSDFKSTPEKAQFKVSSQFAFRYLYLFIIAIPLVLLFIAETKFSELKDNN